ncbi:NAD(P)/FAD-dependent oxidoreductase [Amycolatopsis silviterrae]|uniref:NAD(P)/FAD-dependent oxidoreductase n=1 Tax=Amycolatopsis silviterrae TaxID=1656914 RepID=A0ABW5HL33_9PSEU
MQIVVIGAGVIGLSVATALARRGARVTVVDQRVPGAGTSSTSYAWVNANKKEPQAYYELNLAGMAAHRRLAESTGGGWLGTGGHLEVATDPAHAAELEQRMARLTGHGYTVEEVTAERARQLVPDLLVSPDPELIAYFPSEAHCYPQLYLAHLLTTAEELGVQVVSGAQVKAFDVDGGRPVLRLADGTALGCDRVISCVGRWTGKLLAQADVPLAMETFTHPGDATVGYLAVTSPVPAALRGLLTTSRLNVRPDGAGRLQLQALDLDRTADPRAVPDPGSPLAEELLDRLRSVLRHTRAATVSELRVGQRALPADGLTVAGPVPAQPWLYVVATHSGVTLAPLLGDLVAKEVHDGAAQELLAEFRPDRLLAPGVRRARTQPPRRPGDQ